MTAVRTVSIHVSGRVQGVWFRASTRDVANTLDLTGFIRNLRDGTVYLEASGPPENIDKLIEWCRRGPELARVDSVEVQDITPHELPYPFTILREA